MGPTFQRTSTGRRLKNGLATTLIVLTADRPPELRDTGAGQAIDQIKLYGSFAKWFVEVGNHPAGRDSAIHHRALGCRGATRCDFRYDDTDGEPGRLVLLEINTQPGLTRTSLLPEQAAYRGMSFPNLCAWMVENATCRA